MYSDFYFQEQTSAFMVQVDIVRKQVYMKIASPKTVNQGWATWNWQDSLNYSVAFVDLEKLTDEIVAVATGKATGNVQRAYTNNSKVIAFGRSASDSLFKCAIQNTTKDGGVVKAAFAFTSIEDQSRFFELLNFLTKKKDLFFMAEFIINSSVNYIKTEMYKANKPSGGNTGYNNRTNQPPAASNLDDMFGGGNNTPTTHVNNAVNNVLGDFGGGNAAPARAAIDELL